MDCDSDDSKDANAKIHETWGGWIREIVRICGLPKIPDGMKATLLMFSNKTENSEQNATLQINSPPCSEFQ